MVESMLKPLFIPLRREWFEAFLDGSKREVLHSYGLGWDEHTCQVGRRVILSFGYSARNRLRGMIVSFERRPAIEGAADLAGARSACALIGIEVER